MQHWNPVCGEVVVAQCRCRCAVMLAGLCPDWETWDPQKKEENASEAMQLADDWLGIPQVGVCRRPIG